MKVYILIDETVASWIPDIIVGVYLNMEEAVKVWQLLKNPMDYIIREREVIE